MSHFAFLDSALEKIGAAAPAGCFLSLRIRGTTPLVTLHSYPQPWIDEYTENGYVLRDPITTWALTVGGTVRWSAPFLPDPFRIFRKAAEHGLNFGASITEGPIGARTICSFARSDRELTDGEIAQVRSIVADLHERVQLPRSLEDDQKAVLRILAGAGGATGVAQSLGLGEEAARKRIRQLCDLLIARSPDEAVQRARDHKLL
jgi:LuxR family transcriptional regulator